MDASLSEVLERIQKASNEALLILRNETGIARYLDQLGEIEYTLHEDTRISSPAEQIYAICLQNLVETGRLMANAARMRKESRGSHFRTDFPEQNEDMGRNIILENGIAYFEE